MASAGLARQVALGYPLEGAFSGLGHGIGLGWDAPWPVPGEAMEIVPGMVLNLERTLSRDGEASSSARSPPRPSFTAAAQNSEPTEGSGWTSPSTTAASSGWSSNQDGGGLKSKWSRTSQPLKVTTSKR